MQYEFRFGTMQWGYFLESTLGGAIAFAENDQSIRNQIKFCTKCVFYLFAKLTFISWFQQKRSYASVAVMHFYLLTSAMLSADSILILEKMIQAKYHQS